jgi:mevalonate kinase
MQNIDTRLIPVKKLDLRAYREEILRKIYNRATTDFTDYYNSNQNLTTTNSQNIFMTPTTVTYSAPAKVLFSGEHSVVHGRPALASSIDYRLTFTVTESENEPVEYDKGIKESSDNVLKYLQESNIDFKERNFSYEIESEIPIGEGFGSSAAFSTATTAAFLDFYTGQEFSKEVINDLAYEIEVIFHGKPSGIDNSASCYGGLLFYRKEFEFLKSITPLSFAIPESFSNNFYLVYSGPRVEGTIDLVKAVMAKIDENPELLKQQLFAIENATKDIIKAFESEDEEALMVGFRENQELLDAIGVVSDKARNLIGNLSQFGASKITGAGGVIDGSGYVLSYVNTDQDKFENYLNENGLKFYKVIPEADGVRKEG